MLSFLKNHPFAVEARFDRSIVLTFAVHKTQIKNMIPEPLVPDTFEDKWAFIAVAMVQTRSLRPKGFPEFMGHDFFLIGYRVFVRYVNNEGKKLRGLLIQKSETNKRKMQLLGNIFTHYNYTTTDIRISEIDHSDLIASERSDFKVAIDKQEGHVDLPPESPFNNWKEARRFAGPLPFTFTSNPANRTVLIIEGVRSNWAPTPVKIKDYHFKFLEKPEFQGLVLASAFEVRNIPYCWKKGKLESWN